MDRFHSFYLKGRKTRRINVVRGEIDEKTADRPELWGKMGKNAKVKEKQKWSHEKLHLESARKLRGIYVIDLEDKEFKDTMKNARKKLETPIAPAMPCKIMKNNKNCGSGASNKIKTKLACILEAGDLQDCEWENHCRFIMKTILQEKEKIHYSTTIFGRYSSFCIINGHLSSEKC